MPEQRSKYHHFVPRFLLAGFTDSETREGMLQVYDRERGRGWSSKVEGAGAGVVRELTSKPHAPTAEEVAVLSQVFAIQQVRIPEHRNAMRAMQEKLLSMDSDILSVHVKDEADRARRLQKFQPLSKEEEGARMVELAARTSAGYSHFKWTAISAPAGVPDFCIGSLPALNVTRHSDGRDSVSPGGFLGANFAFLPLTKRLAVKVAAEIEGSGPATRSGPDSVAETPESGRSASSKKREEKSDSRRRTFPPDGAAALPCTREISAALWGDLGWAASAAHD